MSRRAGKRRIHSVATSKVPAPPITTASTGGLSLYADAGANNVGKTALLTHWLESRKRPALYWRPIAPRPLRNCDRFPLPCKTTSIPINRWRPTSRTAPGRWPSDG